jgi:signal peptidase
MPTVKKVWSIVSTVLVAIVVLTAVFLMGSRLAGFRIFNIVSGSMEPQYSVGDLIYVKEVAPETIQVGDVITFVLNEDLVVATHRVVRIDTEKQHFYTKGDANGTEDGSPVHYKNVIGIPQFSIPGLGYVSDFIQHPPGSYITIAAVAVILILAFAPDFVKKKPTTAQPTEAEEENERLKAELKALKAQLEKNSPEGE